MSHPSSAPAQLPLPWAEHLPPPAQACRRCGRPLTAALAVRYGLGERCHARALADHTAQPVDLSAALRAAVDAAQARAAEAARQAQAAVAAPHDLDPARPAAPVLPLPRRPDRPGA